MISTILVERGQVVWRMDPGTARDLCHFIEDATRHDDLARRDAVALMYAADLIDPPEVDDLPADLAALLRDPGILVSQDQAVFDLIAKYRDATSNTASAEIREDE